MWGLRQSSVYRRLFGATALVIVALVTGWWPLMLIAGLVCVAVGWPVATNRSGDARELDRLFAKAGISVGRFAWRAGGAVFVLVGVILVAGAIQRFA